MNLWQQYKHNTWLRVRRSRVHFWTWFTVGLIAGATLSYIF